MSSSSSCCSISVRLSETCQGRHGCRGLDDVVLTQLGVLVVEGELEELRVVCVGNKDIRNGLSEGQAPALTALWQEVAPVLHALANVPDHDAAALGQRIPDGSHQVGGLGGPNHGENGPAEIMLDDARVRLEGEAVSPAGLPVDGEGELLVVRLEDLAFTGLLRLQTGARALGLPHRAVEDHVHVSVVVQPFDNVMSVMLGSSPLPSVSWNSGAVCEAVWMTGLGSISVTYGISEHIVRGVRGIDAHLDVVRRVDRQLTEDTPRTRGQPARTDEGAATWSESIVPCLRSSGTMRPLRLLDTKPTASS